MHTLAAFIGSRGSGKTNACVLLTQRYLDEGIFNRIFIISPTYESNPQFATLHPDPDDIYQSINGAVDDLNEILNKVKRALQIIYIHDITIQEYELAQQEIEELVNPIINNLASASSS